MGKKTRLISPIARGFINLGINILDATAVKHIPVKEIRDGVRLLLEPLKETVRVLSDKDPENAEQLEQLWLGFLRSDEFNATSEKRILQAVTFIEDAQARDFVLRIVSPCLATIRALYDNNPDNLTQIRTIWIEFLTEKENIKAGMSFFIQDAEVLEEVSTIIDSIHDGLAGILTEAL